MPTDREPLLKSVLAAPDDDDVRLVFADWLEENGESDRANVIRLQCEVARAPRWTRRWQEATWLADELFDLHGADWCAKELPRLEGIEWTELERGFVSTIRVRDVAALYAHDAAIGALGTVSRVEMPSLDESTVERPPGSVGWLKTLRLRGEEHTIRREGSLLSAPTSLEIVQLDDDDVLTSLLDWLANRFSDPSAKSELSQLRVEGNHTIGMAFVREFVEATEAAVASGKPAKLTDLVLGTRFIDYDSGYFEDPTLGPTGARILAEAQSLQGLETLDVSRQRIGNDGLAALVEAFPRLRDLSARYVQCDRVETFRRAKGAPFDRLDLSGNALSDGAATVLAGAHRLASLKSLGLDTCEIGAEGLRTLTGTSFWQTLHTLDLSRNPLGSDSPELLAEADPPAELHRLAIADAELDDEALGILSELDWVRKLSSLDLSKNGLGIFEPLRRFEDGAIRELSLAGVLFAATDAEHLFALWKTVWRLDLSRNPRLGDDGLERLLTERAEDLQVLDLRHCKLTSRGLSSIARHASSLPRLRELFLGGNSFDRSSIVRLLDSSIMAKLRVLDVSGCDLGEDVAEVFARAPGVSRLRALNLRRNRKIKLAGLMALAGSKVLGGVAALQVNGDSWTYDGASRAKLDARFGRRWSYRKEEIPPVIAAISDDE